jgi:hypothetical protein
VRRLRREPVGAPEFPLFSFDVASLLDELLVEVGVADLGPVTLTMRSEETLAFIRPRAGGRGGDIHVHSLLNRPDTPRPVIEHVLRHELIHLLVPPREVDGKRTTHPPEFWEHERRLVPWAGLSWNWIAFALYEVIRRDEEAECIRVKRGWRRLARRPFPNWSLVESIPVDASANLESLDSLLDRATLVAPAIA